jgi:pectinesterase
VQQLHTHPKKKNQEVIIIVVSTDGSGNFTTIQAAIDSIPFRNKQPVEINIKEGFYRLYT